MDIVQDEIKAVTQQVRELREDVLIDSMVNSGRLNLLEAAMAKLAEALDKIVVFAEALDETMKVKN